MSWQLFFTGLASGIGLGCMYVVIALSYNLLLAVAGVFNFAQSSVAMCCAILLWYMTSQWGMPTLAIVPAVILVGLAGGLVVEVVAIRPIARRATVLTEAAVVTTIGLGLIAESVATVTFGPAVRSVPSLVPTTPILVGGVPIRPAYIAMALVAIGVGLTLELVIRKTGIGLVLRATLQDAEGARLQGIDTRRVVLISFGVAGALAGGATLLTAPITGVSPFIAFDLALFGFAAVSIGGFGSFGGAMVGGLIVGLISGLVPTFVDPSYTRPVIVAVVFLVLFIRPGGLLGTGGLFGARRLREV